MTPTRPEPDPDAEREVDLAAWRRAVVALWWLPIGGLLVGAVVGVLYSFHGGKEYKASALISLGQPTSPGGALVNGYNENPRAVQTIVSAASVQAAAADRADMRAAALRGHVSIAQVGTAAASARVTPLISLTVTGAKSSTVAAAANALASIVVERTTASYVDTKIRTFNTTLKSVDAQIAAVNKLLTASTAAEKAAKSLDPLQQLVVVSQEDNAEARLGNLIAQQETLQQQLAFATQVESAKVVVAAKAVKSAARSRDTSLIVGAFIGLVVGLIAAIVAEPRRRPVAA
jgi:hypothetical protein